MLFLERQRTQELTRFGLFNDAGYRGLYGMRLSDIKAYKRISARDDLLDCAGRAELAANEFRITQTEQKIVRERLAGEPRAIDTHFKVGREVRQTIDRLGGTMPENLPGEPSIKKVLAKKKRQAKLATREVDKKLLG